MMIIHFLLTNSQGFKALFLPFAGTADKTRVVINLLKLGGDAILKTQF